MDLSAPVYTHRTRINPSPVFVLLGHFFAVGILGRVPRHAELITVHHVHGANQLAPRRLPSNAAENPAVLFDHDHQALARRVDALLRCLFELNIANQQEEKENEFRLVVSSDGVS